MLTATINAPANLAPGQYGSTHTETPTPIGTHVNVQFDPSVSPGECKFPIEVEAI